MALSHLLHDVFSMANGFSVSKLLHSSPTDVSHFKIVIPACLMWFRLLVTFWSILALHK